MGVACLIRLNHVINIRSAALIRWRLHAIAREFAIAEIRSGRGSCLLSGFGYVAIVI